MSPVLITGKLIFQDSWCRDVGWGELLPDDLGTRWSNWLKLLPDFLDIHIPRWVGTTGEGNGQIHVFCDASERAYGAVLYIRSTHKTETLVRIVCSKNRLDPLKKITLPKLELIAALIGARLLHNFCKEMGNDIAEAILLADVVYPTLFIRTTRELSTQQTSSFLTYGSSYPPPRPTSFSPIMEEYGNLSLRERLGGEDGGRGWWAR